MSRIAGALAATPTPTLLLTVCSSGGSAAHQAESIASTSAEAVASGTPERADGDRVIRTASLKADTVRTLADDFAQE